MYNLMNSIFVGRLGDLYVLLSTYVYHSGKADGQAGW